MRQGDRVVPLCSVCPSASVGGGGGRRRALCRRRPLLRRTAVRAVVDLAGGSYGVQIEVGVSLLEVVRGYGQEQGGGGVLTEENVAGARGGRRWPESATGWRCGRPATQRGATMMLAVCFPSGRWRCWRRVMENDGEAR